MPLFLKLHGRFLIALAAGLACLWLKPLENALYNAALGWDIGVFCYLALAVPMMRQCNYEGVRKRARQQDIGAFPLLIMLVVASFFSLFSILSILEQSKELKGWEHAVPLMLAVCTVILSWMLVHTLFAMHYAHRYYGSSASEPEDHFRGGLRFPQEDESDCRLNYWDFLYFAFVVGMTFQVSDVQVTERHMRLLTLSHSVVAFFFNTFILALAVNIAGSAF